MAEPADEPMLGTGTKVGLALVIPALVVGGDASGGSWTWLLWIPLVAGAALIAFSIGRRARKPQWNGIRRFRHLSRSEGILAAAALGLFAIAAVLLLTLTL